MFDNNDISDPTDWHATSLASFAPLEASLRCQICKEFYSSAIITSCFHTFCSLCIRRCIVTDGKCPTCKTTIQEPQLRRNVAIQEVTDSFVTVRPAALALARAENERLKAESPTQSRRSSKRKHLAEEEDDDHTPPASQSQAQAPRRSQRNRGIPRGSQPPPEVLVLDDDEADATYASPSRAPEPPADGLVACPICSGRMPEAAVFSHLNVCDGTAPSSPKKPSRTPTPLLPIQHPPGPPKPPPERLPSLNYSLLKEAALRKKMTDLGIASQGPKALLIRRHTEWRNLWNANCDSSRPRSRRELKDDLDRWERTQGSGGGTERGAEVMKKDFDGSGWARSHKSEFDDLIANARRKRASPVTAAVNAEANGVEQKREMAADTTFEAGGSGGGDAEPRRSTPPDDTDSSLPPHLPQHPPHHPHQSHPLHLPPASSHATSTTPGFNLAASLGPSPTATPVNDVANGTATVSTTLDNYADGGRDVKVWKAEGNVRRKAMFDMPGDPVVDAEMGGSTDGDGAR